MSFPVVTAVSQALESGGKVLVLFNRRGFSTVIKCSECGHVLRCERCEVPLTFIDEKKKMTCSSCDAELNPIKKCPECTKCPECVNTDEFNLYLYISIVIYVLLFIIILALIRALILTK